MQLFSRGAPGEPDGSGASGVRPAARPNRRRLEDLLGEARGNISVLSRRLGVCTKTMYRWLRSADIDVMNFRPPDPSTQS